MGIMLLQCDLGWFCLLRVRFAGGGMLFCRFFGGSGVWARGRSVAREWSCALQRSCVSSMREVAGLQRSCDSTSGASRSRRSSVSSISGVYGVRRSFGSIRGVAELQRSCFSVRGAAFPRAVSLRRCLEARRLGLCLLRTWAGRELPRRDGDEARARVHFSAGCIAGIRLLG